MGQQKLGKNCLFWQDRRFFTLTVSFPYPILALVRRFRVFRGAVRRVTTAFGKNMQICGTGIDLVEVERVRELLDRYGDRFKRRVFTQKEIEYCERYRYSEENYACRFAAKEAALKALGIGKSRGVAWTEVEVTRLPGQAPQIALHGRAKEIAEKQGIIRMHVALTHERTLAQALVIAETT